MNSAAYNSLTNPDVWPHLARRGPTEAGVHSDWEIEARKAQRQAFDSTSERRDLFLEGVLVEDQSDNVQESVRQQRWAQFRELADLLAFTLSNTKLAHLAPKVLGCHTVFRGLQCNDCGGSPFALPTGSCSVRLCPFEMRVRAMRALHRFRPAMESLKEGKYLVLAQRNAPLGGLAESLQSLFAAFARLRQMPVWSGVRGAMVVLEVTFNRTVLEDEKASHRLPWHPHLNVVFDGPYIPSEELRAAWQKATEDRGRTAYISAVDRGTAFELLKYVTKLLDFIDIPAAVEEFLLATRRRRFIRTYGSVYRLQVDEEADTDNNENHGAGGTCPDCGSENIRVVASRLLLCQVHFDPRGVFRVNPQAIPHLIHSEAATVIGRSP